MNYYYVMTNKFWVSPSVINTFVKPESNKTLKPIDTIEWVNLFSSIKVDWVPEFIYSEDRGTPYDRVSSKWVAEEVMIKYIKWLIKEGYIKQLFNYIFRFKGELDISSIENIRLNSQWFNLLSVDSQRKVVLFKLIKKLESTYNPIFIEYYSNELEVTEDNYKKDKLCDYDKNSQIYFLDKSILDTEDKISSEKDNIKRKYLIDSIKWLIGFFSQYWLEIKKNYSLSSLTKTDIDSSLMYKFKALFVSGDNFSFNRVLEFLSSIPDKDKKRFVSIMKVAWVTRDQVESLVWSMWKNFDNLEYEEDKLGGELWFNVNPLNPESPGFLPFASDFWTSSFEWSNAFLSFSQATSLYKGKFFSMISDFFDRLKLEKPNHFWLNRYYLSNIQVLSERIWLFNWELDKENTTLSQCNIWFGIWEDFTEKDMIILSDYFWKILGDFNPEIKEMSLWKWYINAKYWTDEDVNCKGLFKSNAWFEDDSILLLESIVSKDKKLFLNIADFTLDNYIFITIQTAYYLKHKSFIDSKLLFANIYNSYNLNYVDWAEVFDVNSFDPQYRDFVKHVIAPNSIQYNGRIKPSHTILMWTQWTWKSQFILNLVKNRNFSFNEHEFDLNAVVIPIDLMQLKELIKDSSYIKNRLRDVQENTWLPVIITVEDICTLIEESEVNWNANIISQALTTLFEWLWSLSNVTIVSTTNYPERLPPRLTRKGRFECIIPFMPTQEINKIIWFLNTHITRKWLGKILNEEFINNYAKKFIWTTPSHVANFIEEIERELNFKNSIWDINDLTSQEIEKIFSELPFNLDSIKNRQKEMEKWFIDLRAKNEKPDIWFIR